MDRQTYGQTDTWTDRHMNRQTYGQTDIWTDSHMDRQTYEQTDIWTDRHMGRQTYGQTDRSRYTKVDKWESSGTNRTIVSPMSCPAPQRSDTC
jgi:hypothetical protein